MFRSVIHGDRQTVAVLKPNQILMIVSLLGNKRLWKPAFETPKLMMELELTTETNGKKQKTIRIFGKRWEGKG